MDEKRGTNRKHNRKKSARSSFWTGVLEGISGPLMMATRPRARVVVNVIERDGDITISSIENSFENVGIAMKDAAVSTAERRGLHISSRQVRVLGKDGKNYVYFTPDVTTRGNDEP